MKTFQLTFYANTCDNDRKHINKQPCNVTWWGVNNKNQLNQLRFLQVVFVIIGHWFTVNLIHTIFSFYLSTHRMHKGVNENEFTGYEKNSFRQIVCMYSSLNCHRHFLILTTHKIKRHSSNVPTKSRTFIAALPIFSEKLLAPPWQAIQIVSAYWIWCDCNQLSAMEQQ